METSEQANAPKQMSTLQYLRQKAQEAVEKSNSHIAIFEEGEHRVRILANKYAKLELFKLLYVYYPNKGIASEIIISPKTYGLPDPVEEFCLDEIRGGSLSKEEFKRISGLRPSPVYLVPVIKREGDKDSTYDEKFGVKWLLLSGGYPDTEPFDDTKGQFGRIISAYFKAIKRNPELEIQDYNGLDLYIDVVGKDKSGTGYKKIEYSFDTTKTPVVESKTQWKELVASAIDPTKIFASPTYEELEIMLAKSLSKGASGDHEEEEDEKNKASSRRRKRSSDDDDSVEDEIDEAKILAQASAVFDDDDDEEESEKKPDVKHSTKKVVEVVEDDEDDDDLPF